MAISTIHTDAVASYIGSGMSKTDAVKRVAEEHGVALNTVRGALYRLANPGASKRTTTPTAPVDPVAAARSIFETALVGVDAEIAKLTLALETAQDALNNALFTAPERKSELTKRIAALA